MVLSNLIEDMVMGLTLMSNNKQGTKVFWYFQLTIAVLSDLIMVYTFLVWAVRQNKWPKKQNILFLYKQKEIQTRFGVAFLSDWNICNVGTNQVQFLYNSFSVY